VAVLKLALVEKDGLLAEEDKKRNILEAELRNVSFTAINKHFLKIMLILPCRVGWNSNS